MSEKQVIRHCAPTLAGLKTGSLFSCTVTSGEALYCEIGRLNRMLSPKGLCLVVLQFDGKRALIYLYRKTQLRRDLCDGVTRVLLGTLQYPLEDAERCVGKLAERVKGSAEFPHEIGLFLGYPPVDVLGFILMGPRRCKSVGCWKVYGDEDAAKRRFLQYQKCTAAYTALFACGKSLERLTVTR